MREHEVILVKNVKNLLLVICFLLVIHVNNQVVYASCPITESTSAAASSEAEKYYNMLPSGIRNTFESKGWHIEITDVASVNYISALYGGFTPGGYIAGFTESYSRVIMLSDTDAGAAVNHEMGHFFDYISGNLSGGSAFSEIYHEESSGFDGGTNTYAMSDPAEYFADAYREYIECAGYLRNSCPKTFSFIDSYMQPYGGTGTITITEYSRCESHIVEMAAKAAADATANAARSAAQALLDKGANVVGKNAPDVDEWLAGAKDVLDKIANDPDYGTKLADDLNKKIEETDWEQKGTDAANNLNDKLEKLNQTLEETDWEQKGRDAANFLNQFLGAD